MKIKMTEKNKIKIDNTIKLAEGKATKRLLTVEAIEKELENIVTFLGITKKALNGTSVDVNVNAQTFPSSYKYAPAATIFTALYASGSWHITYMDRCTCDNKIARIKLSDSATEAVLESKKSY